MKAKGYSFLTILAVLALLLSPVATAQGPQAPAPSYPAQEPGPTGGPTAFPTKMGVPRPGPEGVQRGPETPLASPPAAPEPDDLTPPSLVTLKPGSNADDFAGFLAWLRFNGQLKDFQRLEGTDAFLVFGQDGLGLIAARSEVAAVEPATPQKVEALQSTRRPSQPTVRPLGTIGITAYTPTTPTVNIYIYNDWVYGEAITGTVYVTITKAADGTIYTGQEYLPSPEWYSIWLDMPYPDIEPGDTVQVYQEGGSGLITIVVPDLRPTIDRDADTVSGKAPVPISSNDENSPPALCVSAYSLLNRSNGSWESDWNCPLTDASGNYTTWFTYTVPTTGTYDIRPFNTYVEVRYYDEHHNSVGIGWQYAPGVQVGLNTDWASGYTQPRTAYTVTLRNSAGVVKGQFTGIASTNGWFSGGFRDAYGNAVKSAAGDTVTLEGAYHITVPVVNLTATADPVADTVTGIAPVVTSTSPLTLPNLYIQVSAGNYITNPTGTYLADSSVVGHFNPGATGFLRYVNTSADRVVLDFAAPVLAARGYYNGYYQADNYVSGYAPCVNCTVSLTLRRAGRTVGTASTTSSSSGWFALYLSDVYGNAADILAGDTVEASAGGNVFASLSIPAFNVASDAENDRVTGTTSAPVITTTPSLSQTLAVWPMSLYDSGYGKHVLPDASGVFTAVNPFYSSANPDWGQSPLDWDGGQQGHYRYINADGYQVYGQFRAPYNYATELDVRYNRYVWHWPAYLNDAYVSGRTAEPNTFVSLALKRGGNTVGTATTTSDGSGYYAAMLRDALNAPVPIQDGDVVEVTAGGLITQTVVPMTAYANYDTDIITGTAPANVITTTPNLTHTLQVGWAWTTVNVTTTADGIYSATLSLEPWEPFKVGFLRYTVKPGTNIFKRWTAIGNPPEAPQVYLRGGGGWWVGYVADNYVYVYASTSGVLTVTRGTTPLATWNFYNFYGDSTYLYGPDGSPLNLQPGDVVQATAGGATTIITVPTVNVTSDPVNDRLTGTTSGTTVITTTYGATRTLALWPTSLYDGDYGKYVLPDASGVFTAVNPFYSSANPDGGQSPLDWNPGTWGHYRYVDANSNYVYGRFLAPFTPKVTVQENGNRVYGYVALPGVPVTVTLKTGTTVRAVRHTVSDPTSAWFDVRFYDASGNPVYIQANDTVEVSASPTIVVPVVPLSGQVNATTNVVSGSGPANASLSVEMGGYHLPAITDSSGAFSVDFTGVYDIRPGDRARIRYINAEGHEVFLENIPAPYVWVRKDTNWGGGAVALGNAPVTVVLKTGTTVKATAVLTSGIDGEFSFDLYSASGVLVPIVTGDTLVVTCGGTTMTLPIPTLTAQVNPASDTVTGQAPAAGEMLRVELYDASGFPMGQKTVTADGSGAYTAGNPWGTTNYDLRAGWRALITYINPDGNQVTLEATAPVVYVRGNASGYTSRNRVSGYATPYAPITVTVTRGGSTIGSAFATADWAGWFDVSLYDGTGALLDIQGGDMVKVTGSAIGTMTVNVPTINATAYAVTDTLEGTIAPAGSSLKVVYGSYVKPVTSDGTTGAFSAGNPFYDSGGNPVNVNFSAGDWVDVHYVDANGHWVYQRFTAVDPTVSAAQIYARWDGSSVKPYAVSGYAPVANAPVNLVLKRGGVTIGFATTTSTSGRWFSASLLDMAGQNVSILAGDVIELTSGGTTVSFTVPDLTAAYNPASQTLFGTGPANKSLYWWTDWWSGTVTTGPDGVYFVDLSGWEGSYGYVRYTDASGNRVYTEWARPYIWVRENGNEVYGRVGAFNAPVVVTLKSGGTTRATATTTSYYDGWFSVYLLNAAGQPAIIAAGDTVEVVAAPSAIVVPVAPLSLAVDLANDRITGVGPAGAQLDVYAGGAWRYPTADAVTGAYTADFAGLRDIRPGDWLRVNYWNEAGNYGIWLGYYAPLVRVNATANIVDGYATPNAPVSLALRRSGSTVATASASTNADGFFSAFFTDAAGAVVDIRAGDVVDVTASPTNSITVPALTASLNPATNVVSGSGPANSLVRVWVFHWTDSSFTSYNKSVSTDSSGAYSADFTGEVDLLDYDYAYVRYTDANGNQSAVNTVPTDSPLLTLAEQAVTGSGAALKGSSFGVANGDDLSTPLLYRHSGGRAVFASRNGTLYITAPNGSIYDTGSTFFAVNNAPAGVWKVQVRVGGEEGTQYAVAAGSAAFQIYLPLTLRNYP